MVADSVQDFVMETMTVEGSEGNVQEVAGVVFARGNVEGYNQDRDMEGG